MSDTPADHPTPLDYSSGGNPRPRVTAVSVVVRTLAVLFAGMLVLGLLMPSRGRAREPSNRIKCSSNLRQLGMACVAYADADGKRGRFPDSVATLVTQSDLTSEIFNCPSSDATRALGPTTQATAAQIQNSPPPGSSGHCMSYVYVGGGLTYRSPTDAVVAYDLPTNHPTLHGVKEGGHVLYVDRTVVWYDLVRLNAIAAAVQAGQNPPPSNLTGIVGRRFGP